MSQGHQEDGTFALSMGGEKRNYIIVIKGQPGGPQSLGIGSQVEFPSEDSRLQLYGPISPISKALQDGMNIGQEEDVDTGICREFLSETQVSGFTSEISFLEEFQLSPLAMKKVGARRQPFDCMNNQIPVIE